MIFENAENYQKYLKEGNYGQRVKFAMPSFQGDNYIYMNLGKPKKPSRVDFFGGKHHWNNGCNIGMFIDRVREVTKIYPDNAFLMPVRVRVYAEKEELVRSIPTDAGNGTVRLLVNELKKIATEVTCPATGMFIEEWGRGKVFKYLLHLKFNKPFEEILDIPKTEKEATQLYKKPMPLTSESPKVMIIAELLSRKFPSLYKKSKNKGSEILIPTFIERNDVENIERILSEQSKTNREALFSLFLDTDDDIKTAESINITTCGMVPSNSGLGSATGIRKYIARCIEKIEMFKKVADGLGKVEEMANATGKKMIFIKALAKYADDHYLEYEQSTNKFWKAVHALKHGRVEEFDIEEEPEEVQQE